MSFCTARKLHSFFHRFPCSCCGLSDEGTVCCLYDEWNDFFPIICCTATCPACRAWLKGGGGAVYFAACRILFRKGFTHRDTVLDWWFVMEVLLADQCRSLKATEGGYFSTVLLCSLPYLFGVEFRILVADEAYFWMIRANLPRSSSFWKETATKITNGAASDWPGFRTALMVEFRAGL